ncbi:cobyric acid synthase [Bacillus tianshenii]|nr:cobyric acid synthase [Bacillus tianshenii]
MSRALPLMIQGTHSDAGKSVIAAAFCRIFADAGYRTAPFKSQNMALNSYITADGKEIGRAQGVQAEAARIEATVEMNPILIKPTGDSNAQIVVNGKPYRNMEAFGYRADFYEQGLQIIGEAYGRLSEQYERIVIEGAGSPAEVNLNDREFVNMKMAEIAQSPVILVGDIERGGVFASLVGTLQLLNEQERSRVIGVMINKFRGDKRLLQDGLDWFEDYTGVPVLGVVPHLHGLNIDAEDSVILDRHQSRAFGEAELDIAVIRLPFISNFTDVDPFFAEEDCDVRFISRASHFGSPDLVIIPGSKNTLADLEFLKQSGLAACIAEAAEAGETTVIGICGGFQMLGEDIHDPEEVESSLQSARGLSLLPVQTTMAKEKRTVRSFGTLHYDGASYEIDGYEIHMGKTTVNGAPLIEMSTHDDGCVSENGRVFGTYFHGLFHNDAFRHGLLNELRQQKSLEPLTERVSYQQLREEAYDKLAQHVKEHVDIKQIEDKMHSFQAEVRRS